MRHCDILASTGVSNSVAVPVDYILHTHGLDSDIKPLIISWMVLVHLKQLDLMRTLFIFQSLIGKD